MKNMFSIQSAITHFDSSFSGASCASAGGVQVEGGLEPVDGDFVARGETCEDAPCLLEEGIRELLLRERRILLDLLARLDPVQEFLRRRPDDVVLGVREAVRLQRSVRDRLQEQDHAPDVVDRQSLAEDYKIGRASCRERV